MPPLPPLPPPLADLLEAGLRWLAQALEPHRPPRRPGRPIITLHEVYPMPREKRYAPTFHFPELTEDEDVEVRELTIAVDGVSGLPSEFPDDAESTDLGAFREGQTVSVSHVDVDAEGNRSKPRVTTLAIKDTVAPPQPGEAGISVRETYVDVDADTGGETPAGVPEQPDVEAPAEVPPTEDSLS